MNGGIVFISIAERCYLHHKHTNSITIYMIWTWERCEKAKKTCDVLESNALCLGWIQVFLIQTAFLCFAMNWRQIVVVCTQFTGRLIFKSMLFLLSSSNNNDSYASSMCVCGKIEKYLCWKWTSVGSKLCRIKRNKKFRFVTNSHFAAL